MRLPHVSLKELIQFFSTEYKDQCNAPEPFQMPTLKAAVRQPIMDFLNTLSQAYTEQTWKQRASIRQAFQSWCLENSLPLTPEIGLVYVHSNPAWKGTTKRQYLRTIQGLFDIGSLTALYMKGSLRSTADEEVNHAVPMTPEDMAALLQLVTSPTDRIVLRLAWSTASRWGEMEKLTVDHFKTREDGKVILDWLNLPKKNQQDIYRDDRFTLLSGTLGDLIKQLKEEIPPGGLITNISEDGGLTRFLNKLGKRKDANGKLKFLTWHSIKRGASKNAAELAAKHHLDTSLVTRMLKHKDKNSPIVRATHVYLEEDILFLIDNETMPALLHQLLPPP